MKFRIIESSPLAWLAKKYMRQQALAITFGSAIHISGVSKEDFLKNRTWLEHELEHVRQYKKYGFFRFILLYLIESMRKGYYNNRFEIEAREKAGQKKHNYSL